MPEIEREPKVAWAEWYHPWIEESIDGFSLNWITDWIHLLSNWRGTCQPDAALPKRLKPATLVMTDIPIET